MHQGGIVVQCRLYSAACTSRLAWFLRQTAQQANIQLSFARTTQSRFGSMLVLYAARLQQECVQSVTAIILEYVGRKAIKDAATDANEPTYQRGLAFDHVGSDPKLTAGSLCRPPEIVYVGSPSVCMCAYIYS